MAARCLLLLVMAVVLSGCASVSEERVALLEAAVMDLQAGEMRLAALEKTVADLVAERNRHQAGASQQDNGPGKAGTVTPSAQAVPPQTTPSRSAPPAPRHQAGASPDNAASGAPAQTPPAPGAPVPAHAGPASTVPKAATAQTTPSRSATPAPRAVAATPKSSASASRHYATALKTLESGKPQAAMALFREFLHAYPDHPLTPNAGYWLGECFYSQKQFEAAILAFKDVVAQYPTHAKAAASMLKAGYSYDFLGDTANARFYLDALVKDFPDSQPAALARARLAAR